MNQLTTTSFLLPDLNEMEMLMKYCDVIAKAPAYESMGGLPGVFALVMTAKELGIGPMTALNGGMYLIPASLDKEGKPKGSPTVMMAAKTMSMMIWKHGHKIEVLECNDNIVTLKGTRADNNISMTVTMTMQKAKQAGLSHDSYGKPKLWSTWFKNPEDMLWKTCVAKLGRRLFTDVIGNAYEPGEFDEKEPKENAVKPEKKTLKGKNIDVIGEKLELLKTENNIPIQTLEEFTSELGLDGPNIELIEYIKQCAIKSKRTYEDMIQYCYENKAGFLSTYDLYKNKLSLENPEEGPL